MQKLSLGPASNALRATRIAYGCMPLGGSWDNAPLESEVTKRAVRSVAAALEAGIDFFDHADIYCRGKSESVFAAAIAELGVKRSDIWLQSKCGIRFAGDGAPDAPHRFDFSYEHIVRSAEQILKRLNTDYLDVLLLHRPDPLVEPDEVARAFDELATSGKVRHFGVSNHTAVQMELLARSLRQPLITNQLQLSLVHSHLLDAGIAMNQGKTATGADGLLDYCRLRGITVQAWGPLASGRALGSDDDERSLALRQLITRLAEKKGVALEAIPIAWLLRHPAGIQPVVGTTDPARIRAAASGDGVELSREEWYELYVAGRGEKLP
ncbi:MAG TPA: aldo/keto reductase [Polyangiaceae bacterium]|nr:aldo/keto reductase [Polyangiaceae bacterium]